MAITIGEWDRFYYNNIYAINKYLFEYGHELLLCKMQMVHFLPNTRMMQTFHAYN